MYIYCIYISRHIYIHIYMYIYCIYRREVMLDEPWTPTKHKQTQRRAGAQGSLGAGGGGMWQTVGVWR